MLGRAKSVGNRPEIDKDRNIHFVSDQEHQSLAASDKGSWFRQDDSWSEAFAEPKSPVSVSEGSV